MKLYLLNKRHRQKASCDICRKWRVCARLPLVDSITDKLVQTLDLCSVCAGEIKRTASEGRKRDVS